MNYSNVEKIISEELQEAKKRIVERLRNGDKEPVPGYTVTLPESIIPKKPLPANAKYKTALELYKSGENHSEIARQLGVSLNATKKYYNWLVKHGYLPVIKEELSAAEKRVVTYLDKGMSLRETANKLDCSVTNVVYRRDSAIRKGYKIGQDNN